MAKAQPAHAAARQRGGTAAQANAAVLAARGERAAEASL